MTDYSNDLGLVLIGGGARVPARWVFASGPRRAPPELNILAGLSASAVEHRVARQQSGGARYGVVGADRRQCNDG